jgi:hypothetical protein
MDTASVFFTHVTHLIVFTVKVLSVNKLGWLGEMIDGSNMRIDLNQAAISLQLGFHPIGNIFS